MQARRTEAETLRAAPSGRRILAADGCASSLSDPGVLLVRRLGPGGPREWRSPCSDTLILGMLICRNEYFIHTYMNV